MYDALHEVPRVFQIWACKQVTNIAGVNYNQAVYMANYDPMCPSCNEEEEICRNAGQLDEDGWNKWSATELPYCICQEAWGGFNGAHCVG